MKAPPPHDCKGARVGPWADSQCWLCWLAKNTVYWTIWADEEPEEVLPLPGRIRVVTGFVRPIRCIYLRERVEFKAGCGGMRCRHRCVLGLAAVPAGDCQTCPEYEAALYPDAADFPDQPAGPGWLDR